MNVEEINHAFDDWQKYLEVSSQHLRLLINFSCDDIDDILDFLTEENKKFKTDE